MKKNENAACGLKTSIGGQALIEGIMMRGPKRTSMAVRQPDGSIFLETGDTVMPKSKLLKVPVIRGIVSFVTSMVAGYKALMRSAELAMPELDEEEEKKPAGETEADKAEENPSEPAAEVPETADEAPCETAETAEETPETAETVEKAPAEAAEAEKKTDTSEKSSEKEKKPLAGQMTVIMIVSIVLALALSIFLFKVIPESVYEFICWIFPSMKTTGWLGSFLRSLITGVLKVFILVGYMAAVSLMKDIKRTFMYHGAEHKSIFCYEKGLPLTVENVREQRRFHPRCGTSFLILSVLVSIFFTMFIPAQLVAASRVLNVLARTGISLLLLPIIMGAGYELIRLAGRHDNLFTRIISAPGVWLQHITTKEPDDGMIECAIAALNEVIPDDGSDRI